jgi:hypothetical protein
MTPFQLLLEVTGTIMMNSVEGFDRGLFQTVPHSPADSDEYNRYDGRNSNPVPTEYKFTASSSHLPSPEVLVSQKCD